MRRIVHYYPAAMGHSGVTFTLWSWAHALAAAGADVHVLHAPTTRVGSDAPFVPRAEAPRLTTEAVPHKGRHRLTLRPVDLQRHLQPDDLLVLHEGWVPANLVAAAAARRAHVPYVVMPQGVYERLWTPSLKGPRWLRNRFERQMLEGAAAVHVCFASEIADIRALAPRAAFLTVPTGFDVPAARWIGGGGYLAWIGRIDPVHKGLDTLIGAVASLAPAERPVVRIRGYDYKGGVAQLRHLIDSRGVGPWVRLEGAIAGAEKLQFMQHADGYVHPSRWECHSVALLEHLALGVPCLVADAIHIAPTLAHSSAAALSGPTERDLATALTAFAAARTGLAPRGRALIGNVFNWNTLIPEFHKALGRLGLE